MLVSSPGRTSKPGPDLYTSPEPPRVAGPTQTSALAADHIERIVRGLVADLGVEPATRVDELLERHIAGLRGPDVTPTMRFSVPSAHRDVLIMARLAQILEDLGLDVDNDEVDRSLDRQFELVELT